MSRIEDIRQRAQTLLEGEVTCRTTHYYGCDCREQLHTKEKLELLSEIDSLRERVDKLEGDKNTLVTMLEESNGATVEAINEAQKLKAQLDELREACGPISVYMRIRDILEIKNGHDPERHEEFPLLGLKGITIRVGDLRRIAELVKEV